MGMLPTESEPLGGSMPVTWRMNVAIALKQYFAGVVKEKRIGRICAASEKDISIRVRIEVSLCTVVDLQVYCSWSKPIFDTIQGGVHLLYFRLDWVFIRVCSLMRPSIIVSPVVYDVM